MRKWKFGKYFDEEPSVEISEKGGYRYMHLGSKTVQSAMKISNPTDLVLDYTKAMMGFLLFKKKSEKVLMIGLGGGSLPKYFYYSIPNSHITVVEKSKQVVIAARQYFHVPPNDYRFSVLIKEGTAWLKDNADYFDVIMVDGYDQFSQVEALASPDFYLSTQKSLTERGVLVINCWTREAQLDKNLKNIKKSFARTIVVPATKKGNVAILAFKSSAFITAWGDLKKRAEFLDEKYGLDFKLMVSDLKEVNDYDTNGLIF